MITRSPSLPHPVPSPTTEHSLTRARTDVGTGADTSVSISPPAPLEPQRPDFPTHHQPSHTSIHSNSVLVNHHHLLAPARFPESPAPSNPPNNSVTSTLPLSTPVLAPKPSILSPTSTTADALDRNRRLSLDGDLPPGAIRPDGNPDESDPATDPVSEGVIQVASEVFYSASIDVAGCSKAGWEPVRGPVPSVPSTHTVEVRKENQDAFCVFAPFIYSNDHHNDALATKNSEEEEVGTASEAHAATPPETYDDGHVNDGSRSALSVQQNSTKYHDQQIFLGVFDGHGAEGRPIAHYARDYIAAISREAAASLSTSAHFELPSTQHAPPAADARLHRARLDTLKAAFSRAERALTESGCGIDHVFSGTTAVVSWLFGREVYTAWTGDSRCVIGRLASSENGRARFRAVDLSYDQKPIRADEKRRVRAAGGRIARWQRNIGPLRVWLPRDWTPGLAMTRSIGDTVLSEYGVSPVPEVSYFTVGSTDKFMVLASDGVWEFMTSQEVVDFVGRVRREGHPAKEASESLVREAVRRWRRNEVVVDDTTAVVMYMSWEDGEGRSGTEESDKKGGDDLLSKSKRVFSRTRAKVSMKSLPTGVHLVTDEGELVDFFCRNDTFQGI